MFGRDCFVHLAKDTKSGRKCYCNECSTGMEGKRDWYDMKKDVLDW